VKTALIPAFASVEIRFQKERQANTNQQNKDWRQEMRFDAVQRLHRSAGIVLFAMSMVAHAAGPASPTKPASVTGGAPKIAVTVNGQPVRADILDQMARARAGVQNPYDEALFPRNVAQAAPPAGAQRTQLIEDLVAMEVLVQKARELGLHQRPQVMADLELQQKTLLSEYMVREIIRSIKIDPAEVSARYAAQKVETQYRISHILVKTEADAKAAIAELDRGDSFEQVVAGRSIDRSAGNDGSLGWLTQHQMLEPFAVAARSLSTGAYTRQPVQTEFGWHVIRVSEVREYKKPLNEQLQNELRTQILQEKVDLRLSQLRKGAKVEVHQAPR
jgi:peptidyl-prolyl cis-trans isomerase C